MKFWGIILLVAKKKIILSQFFVDLYTKCVERGSLEMVNANSDPPVLFK